MSDDLAQKIHSQEKSTCEVLGLDESLVREGQVPDSTILSQVDRFVRKLLQRERNAAAIKSFRQQYPGYRKWLEHIESLKNAASPGRDLSEFVRSEWYERQFKQLVKPAVFFWRDKKIEWFEHKQMLGFARELELTEDDVRKAYAQAARETGDAPPPFPEEPPAPRVGWKPHKVLGEGTTNLWGIADLHEAILAHFDKAIECMFEEETSSRSLIAYLDSQNDTERELEAARKAKQRALRANDPVHRSIAVWEFLWRTGHNQLHLSLELGKINDPKKRVGSLEELIGVLEVVPDGLRRLARLLEEGLLEAWLEVVGQAPEAAKIAAAYRKRAALKTSAQRSATLQRGVLLTLWATGMRTFPIIEASGRVEYSASRVSDIVRFVEANQSYDALVPALELADKNEVCLLSEWFRRTNPALAAKADEASRQPLSVFYWLWSSGSTRIPLRRDGLLVGSLEELLRVTDEGLDALSDESISSGRVALWCRMVIRRPDLERAANEIALDSRSYKAERWRQRGQPRTFKVAGHDANTLGDFARLALAVAEGASPPIAYEDIDAALQSGLPQSRYATQSPEVAAQLNQIAAFQGTADARALLACIAAGLTTLPVSWQAGGALLGRLEDMESCLDQPGFREAIANLLSSGVVGAWLARVARHAPDGFANFVAACAHRAWPATLASADAIVRFGLRRPSCYLARGVRVDTFEQLREYLLGSAAAFALLEDVAVRERVREACGTYGGMVITGASNTQGADEAGLASVPADWRAHAFSWDWLAARVLWLDASKRVTSMAELVEAIQQPEHRANASRLAAVGLVGAWLTACGTPLPEGVHEGGCVSQEAFDRLALWLGEPPPPIELAVDRRVLALEEGGATSIAVTVTNGDSSRTACVVVMTASDHLLMSLDGQDTAEAQLPPGGSLQATLTVRAPSGTSGNLRGRVFAKTQSLDRLLDAPDAITQIEARVRFPAVRVLRSAAIGGLAFLAIGLVLRWPLSLLLDTVGIVALWQKAQTGLPWDPLPKPDPSYVQILGCLPIAGLMALQRVGAGISAKRPFPRATNATTAFVWGLLSLVVFVPVASCRGCINNTGAGAGAISGMWLSIGLFLFLLLRPGALYSKDDGDSSGMLGHDIVFALFGAALVFLSPWVGMLCLATLDGLDMAALMTARTLGGAVVADATHVLLGTAEASFIVGILIGAAYGLRKSGRNAVGLITGISGPLLFIALVGLRGTLGGPLLPPALADEEQCSAAAKKAIGLMLPLEPGKGIPIEVYRSSHDYADEVVRATAACLAARATPAELGCIERATNPETVVACGPPWTP